MSHELGAEKWESDESQRVIEDRGSVSCADKATRAV
jgi:hypothetical protein